MFRPVWNDSSVEAVEVDRSHKQSDYLDICGDSSLDLLRSGTGRNLNIRSDVASERIDAIFSLLTQEQINVKSLRVLPCFVDATLPSLISFLSHQSQLQQLCVNVIAKHFSVDLCNVISSLSLTALRIDLFDTETTSDWPEQISHVVTTLQPTLRSLEIACRSKEFCLRFFEHFDAPRLRNLYVFGCAVNVPEMQAIIRALVAIPNLDCLGIECFNAKSILELARSYFAVFRPLRLLRIWFATYSDQALQELFDGLKRNTQLLRLQIPSNFDKLTPYALVLSNAGWLIEVSYGWRDVPESFVQNLERNKRRHDMCFKICSALIVLTRKRKLPLFSTMAMDVICLIVKIIWDTRNQDMWDEEEEEDEVGFRGKQDAMFWKMLK